MQQGQKQEVAMKPWAEG